MIAPGQVGPEPVTPVRWPARVGLGALCGAGAGAIGGALAGVALSFAVLGFSDTGGMVAAYLAGIGAGAPVFALLRRRVGGSAALGLALAAGCLAAYAVAVVTIFPRAIAGMGGVPMPAAYARRFGFYLVVPAIGALYGAIAGAAAGLLGGTLLGALQTERRLAPPGSAALAGVLVGAVAILLAHTYLTGFFSSDAWLQALALIVLLTLPAALAGHLAQDWHRRRLLRHVSGPAPRATL